MNSEPNFNGRLVLPHLGTLRRLVVRPSVPREGSSGELAVFSPRQAAACVRKQKEKDRLLTACRNQDAPLLSRARSFVRYTISNGFVTPIGNQETFPQVVDVEARGLIDTAVYVDAAVLES